MNQYPYSNQKAHTLFEYDFYLGNTVLLSSDLQNYMEKSVHPQPSVMIILQMLVFV